MATTTIQVRKKGSLTLPIELRAKYGVDMGDGSFLLTPRVSQVNCLGDRVAEILRDENVSLDDLLTTLDEEREQYYKDRYAKE